MWASAWKGWLGAALTGLMVLIFLRDWRSVIAVVLNIPSRCWVDGRAGR